MYTSPGRYWVFYYQENVLYSLYVSRPTGALMHCFMYTFKHFGNSKTIGYIWFIQQIVSYSVPTFV